MYVFMFAELNTWESTYFCGFDVSQNKHGLSVVCKLHGERAHTIHSFLQQRFPS